MTIRSHAPFLPADLAWGWLLPSWPVFIALAALARALAAPLALLNDPDTYLHIAAGRWILAHGALPLHDPFSYSMAGAVWVPSEWLAEIALAAAHDAAGWAGPILLAAGCFAAALALLTRQLLRCLEPLPALIAAMMAGALLLPHLLARPHALALPLLVLWSGVLFAARDADRPPPFVVLPAMVLWVNLHGSFMFGLALAAFLGGEAVLQAASGRRAAQARRWGVFVLAAVVAALLTPNGLAGFVQPFRLLAMPTLQSAFIEWQSPDFHTFSALELWILGAVLIGFATGARLPAARIALLLGLVHMALQHSRHADILGLVGPLAAAAPLASRLAVLTRSREPSGLSRGLARLALPARAPALVLAAGLAVAVAAPTALRPIARVDDAVTPGTAVAAAGRFGLAGPVFNAEAFGGYLIFRGVPDFIDGRIEMYGDDFLAQDAAAERGDAAAVADILARYRIGWTLLSPQAGAVAVLDRLPGWQRIYADAYAVIHRRIEVAPR